MVNAHTKDLNAFEEATKNANNTEVKAFAERTLPVIKLHLKTLESMEKSDLVLLSRRGLVLFGRLAIA